jgi:hypothetical protein
MRRLAWTLLLLAGGVASPPGRAAPTAEIEDLAPRWDFKEIEAAYRDGERVVLCVQTRESEYALWDPLRGHLSKPRRKHCSGGSHLKLLGTEIAALRAADLAGPDAPASTTPDLLNDASIWRVTDESPTGCPVNLDHYFVVRDAVRISARFYVIRRYLTPSPFAVAQPCNQIDGKNPLQGYEVSPTLAAVALGQGAVLLYAYDGAMDFTEPVLLLIHRLPASVWSSNDDVFVVPWDDLGPGLAAAGGNLAARNAALLTVIHRPAP